MRWLAWLGSSRWALIGVAAMLVAAGFVLGSGYAYSVDRPQWQAGDSWSYEARSVATGTYGGYEFHDEEADGGFRMTVLQVLEGTADGARYLVEVDDASGYDSEEIPFSADLNPMGPMPGLWPCEFDCLDAVAGSFHEIRLLKFPLRPGASWNVAPPFAEDMINVSVRARGEETVDTAAGTFTAIRIKAGDLDEALPPEAEGFGFDVKAGFDYWYAPEARWIVKMVWWFEGSDGDNHVRAEWIVELTDQLNIVEPLDANVAVTTEASERPTIEIVTPEGPFEAGEAIELEAIVTGVEDATVVWEFPYRGTASGDATGVSLKGEQVEFTPDWAGTYPVLAQLKVDKKVIATDSAQLKVVMPLELRGSNRGTETFGWGARINDGFRVVGAATVQDLEYSPGMSLLGAQPDDDLFVELYAGNEKVGEFPLVDGLVLADPVAEHGDDAYYGLSRRTGTGEYAPLSGWSLSLTLVP